jgi:hypothetical protein
VTLPLNLPAQDKGVTGDDRRSDAATASARKAEERRSSLASQVKLTRIVEESEHEASTSSSKEMSAARINADDDDADDVDDDDDDDDDHVDDDNDDDDDDDFDSECSEVSDLDPKLDELVDQFRAETRDLIRDAESTFLELQRFETEPQPAAEGAAENVGELGLTGTRVQQSAADLGRLAIRSEIEKLSCRHDSKQLSVHQSDRVLEQVQTQLAEIMKSIKVKKLKEFLKPVFFIRVET